MVRNFTLEYWIDDDWYVGRLKEVPGVFSQGKTLAELEENIRDAYQLLMDDDAAPRGDEVKTKEIGVELRSGATSSGSWSSRDVGSNGTVPATTCS